MRAINSRRTLLLALLGLVTMPAFAQPPWAKGGGKGGDRDDDRGGDRNERGRGGKGGQGGRQFSDRHRVAVHNYYQNEFKGGGFCPPGLAKKHNGCMPPGQARKWQMGRALPSDVVVYPVPHELEVQIGLPPAGYKYVRVASDILMIAVGTSIVADAIKDLGRR